MKINITNEEISEIAKVCLAASLSNDTKEINWEIISKFLAKLDMPIYIK